MTDHEKAECIRAFARNFAEGAAAEAATGDDVAVTGHLLMGVIAERNDAEILEILNGGESK